MSLIKITPEMLMPGAVVSDTRPGDVLLSLDQAGAGLDLTWLRERTERYLVFFMEARTENSLSVNFLFYSNQEPGEPVSDIRFGVLPGIRTMVCIDLSWLDAKVLFPETRPGQLKIVYHGRRVEKSEIEKLVFLSLPMDNEVKLWLSDLTLTDERPADALLPDVKLVDPFGQNKKKEWSSKLHSEAELKALLNRQAGEAEQGYPFENWSAYGGWKEKKLTDGTGFFSKKKEDGRWWLVDPDGYAFFSMGPDGVVVRSDCRVDDIEKWMDWLPEKDDPVYADMYETHEHWPPAGDSYRKCTLFSFEMANLYRAFGEDWYAVWRKMLTGQLKKYGMNTLGNWSDPALLGIVNMPYVTSLEHFPGTKQTIFRDFPDVLSEEYAENARICAKALEEKKDDPWMIGYFLRNEPAWAFVDHLVLADEVLFNPARTACKEQLIVTLKEKYKTVEALNAAWDSSLSSFDALYEPRKKVSSWSEAAREDMRAFSRRLVRAYVEIPSKACRKVDPNHMILGMRWAWISDPDIVTGWENFDVFSINCYAVDPTAAIQNVADQGVDLPVMIGEFHFGALDAGPSATGLEGVKTQKDRGIAYRHYCEHAAAHPCGVGCHYFQCYDQFTLGRFDGENYNIGLFDICSQPYPEMMSAVKSCSETIYRVAAGEQEPTKERAQEAAMIAY